MRDGILHWKEACISLLLLNILIYLLIRERAVQACKSVGEVQLLHEVNGWHILNEKVLKELESIKLHVTRGCLSDIKPGCGTNKNENLHRCINPFFSRCRIGIPLAVALLTVLFHRHNQKLSTTATDCSILSARSLYSRVSNFSNEDNFCFGIIKKTNIPDIDNWIFGKQKSVNMIHFPSTVSKVIDFSVSPEIN